MARPQTASLPELKFSFLLHLAVGGGGVVVGASLEPYSLLSATPSCF